MGKPKFSRKKYDTPLHPWKEDRIKSERELIKKYGLKNNREVWKSKTYLKKYREQARELLAKVGEKNPQVKKESEQLLLHLTKMSILPSGSSLDDVLALETESILSRRLQTLVYHRGLANTIDHARQLVSHGHIAIGDRKITIPGYMVTNDEENQIGYTTHSVLNELSHPARPKTDVYKSGTTVLKKELTEKPEGEAEKPAEKPKEPSETTKEVSKEGKIEPEIKKEEPKEEAKEEPPEEKPAEQPTEPLKEEPSAEKTTEEPQEPEKPEEPTPSQEGEPETKKEPAEPQEESSEPEQKEPAPAEENDKKSIKKDKKEQKKEGDK